MSPTRTSRIELRSDPERERRIRQAAEIEHQSVSAFVLEAAARRAEIVIAAASATTVSSDFFDMLWDALDETPVPNAALQRRAQSRPPIDQQ
ncbi:MAG: DUF1778 domain-containing protein [Actinobacteria bacterium]|nr:DUF1778 domain-containing protein [Actinomycetota bacterium]MCB9389380.1 DUF1778 domain-containing protein [Acidimicrobiia bacterium]